MCVCVCVCVCAVLRPAEGPDDRKVIAYKRENQEQARAARLHYQTEKTLEKARGDAEATDKQRKLERKVQKRREKLLLQQQQQAASGPGPARNTTAHNGVQAAFQRQQQQYQHQHDQVRQGLGGVWRSSRAPAARFVMSAVGGCVRACA